MTEATISDADRKAVKCLKEYFRRRAWDLKYHTPTDDNFMQWLGDVMKSLRAEEYQHVKQILETDPAFTNRKGKTQ